MDKLAKLGNKLLNIFLVVNGFFFLVMGFTDIGQDPFGVKLGFSVGIPFLGIYLYRRLRARRAREAAAAAAEQKRTAAARRETGERSGALVTICPHCGAPGRGSVCEYCGMSKN